MARRYRFALLVALAGLGLPHLVRADEPATLTRREKGDLAIKARAILHKYCSDCHGEKPRHGDISVVKHSTLIATGLPIPFVNREKPKDRSQIIEFLEDGSMPPGGRDRPSTTDIATLKKWIEEAASASYPMAFDDRTTLDAMLTDFEQQSDKNPDAAPYLRYLSLAHLIRDDQELPNLELVEQRLRQALLALSNKPVVPVPVDGSATLFRLDIRSLGWEAGGLFRRVVKDMPRPDVYPMVPFDLILLEYPFGMMLSAKDDLNPRLGKFLDRTKQLRPMPFLRADWLANTLYDFSTVPPKSRPLAEELKSLVALAAAKQKDAKPLPCGLPSRAFLDANPVDMVHPPIGTAMPPFSSWYSSDINPDPFGLTFEAVLPLKGFKTTKEVDLGEEYKFRVTAKREVRFLLVNVRATGNILETKTNGGNVLSPGPDGARILGHTSGGAFNAPSFLTGKPETEHWILIAAETEIPPPTIVCSIHSDSPDCREKDPRPSPIWRFIFDAPSDKFDPNKAVRKVVSIKLKQKPE
jgi:mono/diheme cytochrome c family protein